MGLIAIGALRYYNAVVKVQNPSQEPGTQNLISGDKIRLQRQGARSTKDIYLALRKDEVVSTEQMVGQFGIQKWILKMRNGAKYVIYGPNAPEYIMDRQ